MSEPKRIPVEEVRDRMESNAGLLLVCAYEDEAKCRKQLLDGAIPLALLEERADAISEDREIVFYCS
jgi:hypothetical protein